MENDERKMQNVYMQRPNDLLDRTKQFALATIQFCEGLPKDETSRVLGRQSAYWIELLRDAGKVDTTTVVSLHGEAGELVAIAISSINTARRNSESQD